MDRTVCMCVYAYIHSIPYVQTSIYSMYVCIYIYLYRHTMCIHAYTLSLYGCSRIVYSVACIICICIACMICVICMYVRMYVCRYMSACVCQGRERFPKLLPCCQGA